MEEEGAAVATEFKIEVDVAEEAEDSCYLADQYRHVSFREDNIIEKTATTPTGLTSEREVAATDTLAMERSRRRQSENELYSCSEAGSDWKIPCSADKADGASGGYTVSIKTEQMEVNSDIQSEHHPFHATNMAAVDADSRHQTSIKCEPADPEENSGCLSEAVSETLNKSTSVAVCTKVAGRCTEHTDFDRCISGNRLYVRQAPSVVEQSQGNYLDTFGRHDRLDSEDCQAHAQGSTVLVRPRTFVKEHISVIAEQHPKLSQSLGAFPRLGALKEDGAKKNQETLKQLDSLDSKQRPHACSQCDATFIRTGHLKQHMLTHTGERPHQCKLCSSAFNHSGSLKRHMLTHTKERPYQCGQCSATFADSGTLGHHMVTHSEERPHHCTVCDAAFKWFNSLKTHMLNHTGVKPHKCNQCNAAFTRPSSLKQHMLRHTEERPHQCSQCRATFKWLSNLKAHMLIHTGERPYPCTQCDAAFTCSSALKKHNFKHTGEKPHQCTICEAAFSRPSYLQQHMSKHAGLKHSCTLCDATFTRPSNLKEHVLTHAGE
ncbi:zinc finger protein 555-like [Littorina saxatilis]|uniref:zinc finger protein 555-like n=1 Tax=Littorina saxatilis TaxID=31220 RepID=UPI0038B5FAC6